MAYRYSSDELSSDDESDGEEYSQPVSAAKARQRRTVSRNIFTVPANGQQVILATLRMKQNELEAEEKDSSIFEMAGSLTINESKNRDVTKYQEYRARVCMDYETFKNATMREQPPAKEVGLR